MSILEREIIQSLFEDMVKIFDFQIFIDSDRKTLNFYMAFIAIR